LEICIFGNTDNGICKAQIFAPQSDGLLAFQKTVDTVEGESGPFGR
jgi:hypothetical protein